MKALEKVIFNAILGVFAVGVILAFAQVAQRPLNQAGLTQGWSFGTAVPTVANDGRPPFDGEPYVLTSDGSDPLLMFYNDSNTTWETTPMLENDNSFTGSNTLGNNEDDLLTVNSPVNFRVWREDFEGPYRVYDWTNNDGVAPVADDEPILMIFQNMTIVYEHEVAFAGTVTENTFMNTGTAADGEGRVWLIDNATMVDAVDNDAVEFVFGGLEIDGGELFIEEATDSLDAYCEISIRIDDISDISALDFYFGWFLNTAIDDTFAFTGNNTWAAYVVNDTAGDLQVCAEEDGDTHGCDDAGVTLADDGTYVLRVEIGADGVVFAANGTAPTITNAVMDADATDQFVCRMGARMASASVPTYELEYVEFGKEQ